jgi:hypothetical protein
VNGCEKKKVALQVDVVNECVVEIHREDKYSKKWNEREEKN